MNQDPMDDMHARDLEERVIPAAPRLGATGEAEGPSRHPRSRLVCLLTTLHPERSLSRALIQHLSQEMADIDFTLQPRREVDAVWVVGYERGAHELVEALRRRHPRSTLVVTGRRKHTWEHEVRVAGADVACGWPVPYAELSGFLHRRRLSVG